MNLERKQFNVYRPIRRIYLVNYLYAEGIRIMKLYFIEYETESGEWIPIYSRAARQKQQSDVHLSFCECNNPSTRYRIAIYERIEPKEREL